MALTDSQKISALDKKSLGKSSTDIARDFFEEPYNGRAAVFNDQIWIESDDIPTTAPVLAADAIAGVVQYKEDLVLAAVPGAADAFYHADLVDAIPFNFGDGSYNYVLKDSTDAVIPFGQDDWRLDPETGVIYFYDGAPANMPPKVSFYKYVGDKGAGAGGGGAGGGLLNYSPNPFFIDNIDNVNVAGVPLSVSLDATDPLFASVSDNNLKIAKTAVNAQGDSIVIDSATFDDALRAKGMFVVKLTVKPDNNYVHNSAEIYVTDGVNRLSVGEVLIEAGTTKEYQVLAYGSPAAVETVIEIVDPTTTAYTMLVNGHYIGELGQVVIDGITPWQDVTITGTFTNATYTAKRRYVGKNAEYLVNMVMVGTPASTTLELTLPTGDVIDTAALLEIQTLQTSLPMSNTRIFDAGTASYPSGGAVYVNNTTIRPDVMNTSGGSRNFITQAIPMTWVSGDKAWFSFSVPLTRLPISNTLTNFELGLQTARVQLSKNASQSIANGGSFADVTWQVASRDPFSWRDGNTIVVGQNIRAKLKTNLVFSGATNGARAARIFVNATKVAEGIQAPQTNLIAGSVFAESPTLDLVAGDIIKVQAYQSSGSALSLVNDNATYFVLEAEPDYSALNAIPNPPSTWQDVTASRAFNTTYTNTTGRGLEVSISIISNAVYTYAKALVGGVRIADFGNGNSTGERLYSYNFTVPRGSTYRLEFQSAPTIIRWFELEK